MSIKNIKKLLKILYKNNKDPKLFKSKSGEVVFTFFVLISVMFLSTLIEYSLYRYLKQLNAENMMLTMSILLTNFIIVVSTIPVVFRELSCPDNFNSLIILPIKEFELLCSKFIIILIKPIIISMVVFLTTSITFGFLNNKDIIYYLLALTAAIVIPVISTAIIVGLMIVFMKVVNKNNISKFRGILNLVPLVLSIVIVLSVKFINFQNFLGTVEHNGVYNFLVTITGIKFIVRGLVDTKHQVSTIFVAIAITILYVILIYFLSKYYRFVVSKNLEGTIKTKPKQVHRRNQLLSLVLRDFKMLVRNPFLLVNILLRTFTLPITIFVLILFNHGMKYDMLLNNNFISTLQIIFIVIFIESRLNFVSATSLSRENKDLLFMYTLPIKDSIIILSKVILGCIINSILLLITITVLGLVLSISWLDMTQVLFGATIICIYGSLRGVMLDLENPYLDYTKEEGIFNSNPNMIRLLVGTIIESLIVMFIVLKFGVLCMMFLFGVLGNIFIISRINKLINHSLN